METFKELTINADEKLCYLKGNIVNLSKSEYNMLNLLMNNKNKIFTREEIIKEAWDKNVSNRAVDTTVSRLRKKLDDYGNYIVSRTGFGYGFMESKK